ncbi:hypothetical protein H2201_007986 [Coniosporium apollinis]|uniref:Uncharacterized protein n=2 Tax=Coniosporium TaxID=2810619 RepID=A0ABQ9NH87_9PEZI|nr:hypothetical protein H2199_005719 [Cladosporium sp. JES 115]KAJ9657877.1 hypothetical protein H2201_007986 [Coniosporium apollinis]
MDRGIVALFVLDDLPTEKSPSIGKTLQECADFLRNAPPNAYLDRNFFAVIDKDTLDKNLITLCRIGNRVGEGDELTSLPVSFSDSSVALGGMDPDNWDEWLEDFRETGRSIYDRL